MDRVHNVREPIEALALNRAARTAGSRVARTSQIPTTDGVDEDTITVLTQK
jgi:hypothetical protein